MASGRGHVTGSSSSELWLTVQGDDEAAKMFLRDTFILGAMEALFYARKNAGLTQTQLAARLFTTQSVVARTEHDGEGAISLKRYLEWCMACNALPELSVAPLGSATNAALALLSADLGSKAAQTAAQAAPEGMQEANCEGLVEPDNLESPPADEGLAA